MKLNWVLALLGIALSATALGVGSAVWANTPLDIKRATHQYRCDAGRNLIALERPTFVSLMVAGRSYELTWTDASTARGHGLIWRVSKDRAALTRASSGFAIVSGCARVAARI